MKIYRKKMIFGIITILFFSSLQAISVNANEIEPEFQLIKFQQDFSNPVIEKNEEFSSIKVKEANSFNNKPGEPNLPMFSKTFELPWGSKISDIIFQSSDSVSRLIKNKIEPVPIYRPVSFYTIQPEKTIDSGVYQCSSLYPTDWYSYQQGAGLNKNGKHVLYVTIYIYPVRYIPQKNIIEYIKHCKIIINYEKMDITSFDDNIYDLILISPSEFANNLTKLIEHKNSYNMKTTLVLLENIIEKYPGRDTPEKIKYCIKYAVEKWGIKYVLLVGDIKHIPIRNTDAYPWKEFHGSGILTDLYYSDLYDENFNFASWDTNNDSIFGQVIYNWTHNQIEMEVIDEVDLYADIHIGRLACRNIKEVEIVVDKIISYEVDTYEKAWFKKIVLAGGDTFPPSTGSPLFVYEGEITNEKVAQQLPEFEHKKLWASKRNLNAITFNRAINKGAGFVSYAGHGFEHGWGTYKPNALRKSMGFTNPLYYTPFIQFLNNNNMLPIIFWDACLTAKLDFNIGDLASYYKEIRTIIKLIGVEIDPTNYLPSFAWCFLIEEDGGAIGTIGATRPAYSHVNKNGVHSGAGYLDFQFFKAYEDGINFGNMYTQSQAGYINNIGRDYFTIEEYILLGDPSLITGGYP
jgi:hypothetical protein